MSIIQLGATVRDILTGYEGVVVARYEYLHGCTRIAVQARELKDGKPLDDLCVDEQRLRVLDVPNILEEMPLTNKPGGDRPIPPARSAPRF